MPTTYRICAPHFVAAVVVESDAVVEAAPILGWATGKDFIFLRDFCQRKGWSVEPLISSNAAPETFEYKGITYKIHWRGGWIRSITVDGDDEITFDQLPDVIKRLL